MSAAEFAGEEEKMVACKTSKEIKKEAKPEFAANPDKFYPTTTLRKLGFSRAQCPKCENYFWRHSDKRVVRFIGRGTGKGARGTKITYAEAWKGFEKSLTSSRIPCTSIKRYPVVARWRADVDYVAAGIYCFQPYCVTGELEPPANPLIQPQFCLRFNDLDNIGLTGRHYSGFIMLGIQVFNTPEKFVFFKEECVEFNMRWLTEELEIDPDEITLIEDVWAGGGNMGPSIEYFISGLELGNMVFMQYKTFPDGRREELPVQIIDVGIGLERIPWLVNGTPTSYCDVFPRSLEFFLGKLDCGINNDIWAKYGPYSCLLNVDEVEDLAKTWEWIAGKIGQPVAEVRAAIEPIRDMYIVLDHTRTVLMAVEDGSLPSNVGGASNVRNILRRVFHVLHKNKGSPGKPASPDSPTWWTQIGELEGLLQIFRKHKEDLATVYGEFPPYKSFDEIIKIEYDRWCSTDDGQKAKLVKILQKRSGKLLMEDWIVAVTSWGLPADKIGEISGLTVPENLYYEIAQQQERSAKPMPTVLYNTSHLAATESMYFGDHHCYDFEAKILAVLPNVERKMEPSVVVLDQSAFYPTSGGQEHDTGSLTIGGTVYQVVDALKVGPCVLHIVSPPLPSDMASYVGQSVTGHVDEERRAQLRNHHTATHIVFASCRRVLGPHVWQHGAKKTTEKGHLDITHYRSLTHEEVTAIEAEANRIVSSAKDISKSWMPKDEAEKKHGFHLYQGGVVPGNSLRVVHIDSTDTEACCGTHCDNTSEVGLVRILKTGRISDGILRLYYVAGKRALEKISDEAEILHELCDSWAVQQSELVSTASRFFDGYKKFSNQLGKKDAQILELQMKALLLNPELSLGVVRTDAETPTHFISTVPNFAAKLKAARKGIVFVGDTFLFGVLGDTTTFDVKALDAFLKQADEEATKKVAAAAAAAAAASAGAAGGVAPKKKKVELVVKTSVGKAKATVDNISQFQCFAIPNATATMSFLLANKFVDLDA